MRENVIDPVHGAHILALQTCIYESPRLWLGELLSDKLSLPWKFSRPIYAEAGNLFTDGDRAIGSISSTDAI
jgi:hypothetical protein